MVTMMLVMLAAEPGPKLQLGFGGRLQVDVTEALAPVAPGTGLVNQKVPRSAKLKRVKLGAYLIEEKGLRDLTPTELERVAYAGKKLVLRSFGVKVEHTAPNGKHFTAADAIKAIEATELEARAKTDWYEGIDAHHVFFEGAKQAPDGAWELFWGS